jgi:hypothetical protein
MAFDIVAYAAKRIKAEAKHGGHSHWVDITVIEPQRRGPSHESTITVHFNDGLDVERKANAYAEAINSVDRLFHPKEIAMEIAADA